MVEFDPVTGLPKRIEHFTIIEKLGEGGMGFVFRARDDDLDIDVALKVVRPEVASDPISRQRFLREARASAALGDHDHIVPVSRVKDLVLEGGQHLLYLVMPLLAGEPLDKRLERATEQPLSIRDQLLIGRQIAMGLAGAHEAGLIHRDIKPGNIWLEQRRNGKTRVRILDFGLARSAANTKISKTGQSLGTPAYKPLEQWRTSEVDHRADLYSFGVVLFEMATGRLPFDGDNEFEMMINVFQNEPHPIRELAPTLPGEYAMLIERLLSKSIEARPESAIVVRDELGSIAKVLEQKSRPVIVRTAPPLLTGAPTLAEIVHLRQEWANFYGVPLEYSEDLGKGVNLEMVFVPPGRFWMGSPETEADRSEDETQHEVTISEGCYIGKYPVTQQQYEVLMGTNPSSFRKGGIGADKVKELNTSLFPVERVNWQNAQDFLINLTDRSETNGKKRMYRLPREAEWEYICRGGACLKDSLPFHFESGPQKTLSSTEANFDGNHPYGGAAAGPYLERTSKVGDYKPNRFCVYDMHGNVWEWCGDWYDEQYNGSSPKVDPPGPETGVFRVLRGGGWSNLGWGCRASFRNRYAPTFRSLYFGFRVLAPRVSQ